MTESEHTWKGDTWAMSSEDCPECGVTMTTNFKIRECKECGYWEEIAASSSND